MNPKILEEVPLSIYDLREEMKKVKKRDEELNIRSGKTEEYINQFAELKKKDAEDLEKEIIALDVPRLKDLHVKKIMDTLPISVEELKVVLQGYTLTVNKDYMKKIVDVVKKYKQ